MHFRIIAVGRVREPFAAAGVEEYLKRLQPYGRFEVVELADEPVPTEPSPGQEKRILAAEGQRIRDSLHNGEYVVCLDRRGTALSSESLAALLDDLAGRGRSNVAFVIGGTLGLDPTVLVRADLKLSLSAMTFPHQLARLMVVEQIYRAFKISRGEPYHH
ncbi:MAG TPA: 23S rRNA (pseudouridine(1915)-N(3))-methyltransferase RlmH [Bacillota bacterium]